MIPQLSARSVGGGQTRAGFVGEQPHCDVSSDECLRGRVPRIISESPHPLDPDGVPGSRKRTTMSSEEKEAICTGSLGGPLGISAPPNITQQHRDIVLRYTNPDIHFDDESSWPETGWDIMHAETGGHIDIGERPTGVWDSGGESLRKRPRNFEGVYGWDRTACEEIPDNKGFGCPCAAGDWLWNEGGGSPTPGTSNASSDGSGNTSRNPADIRSDGTGRAERSWANDTCMSGWCNDGGGMGWHSTHLELDQWLWSEQGSPDGGLASNYVLGRRYCSEPTDAQMQNAPYKGWASIPAAAAAGSVFGFEGTYDDGYCEVGSAAARVWPISQLSGSGSWYHGDNQYWERTGEYFLLRRGHCVGQGDGGDYDHCSTHTPPHTASIRSLGWNRAACEELNTITLVSPPDGGGELAEDWQPAQGAGRDALGRNIDARWVDVGECITPKGILACTSAEPNYYLDSDGIVHHCPRINEEGLSGPIHFSGMYGKDALESGAPRRGNGGPGGTDCPNLPCCNDDAICAGRETQYQDGLACHGGCPIGSTWGYCDAMYGSTWSDGICDPSC